MPITAEVYHIYFHKMHSTLTATSETINIASCLKQQHKYRYIDAKKIINQMLKDQSLNYSIPFLCPNTFGLKTKQMKQKTTAHQQIKTSSIGELIHNVITILQQKAGKCLALVNETHFWM